MRWNYFKYSVWALATMLAVPVLTGTGHAGRIDETSNYWPWMAVGGILTVLSAIALCARRSLPSEARI